jgi:hypothetical protein
MATFCADWRGTSLFGGAYDVGVAGVDDYLEEFTMYYA